MQTVHTYISAINHIFQQGNTTEHSYRSVLCSLIETLDETLTTVNEPQGTNGNKPDISVYQKRSGVISGYTETKDIGEDLENKKFTEQFDRYRTALGHIIFTDYLRFQFWHNGELLKETVIGEVRSGKIVPLPENFIVFADVLKEFFRYHGKTIATASELAAVMAHKTVLLARHIAAALNAKQDKRSGRQLHDLMEQFQDMLLPALNTDAFADVYAQTITYGLFIARFYHKDKQSFSRGFVSRILPPSNPLLRRVFQEVAGDELDERIVWVVDDLTAVFNAADFGKIMNEFDSAALTADPVIHFYESFLAAYNPEARKDRGVFYTPLPIVDYIIRFIDETLIEEFDLHSGLADNTKSGGVHKLHILDPATGTGTFIAEIVKFIYQRQKDKGQLGTWQKFVSEGLLPRLHGFEILMAPYAVAHLKLDVLLQNTGYQFDDDEQVGIYLTNSLDEGRSEQEHLTGIRLVEEAVQTNRVKRKYPVLVVIGNPPYKSASANKSKWSKKLIACYKVEAGGRKLEERNGKWLNDDYVKFIRLAEQSIEKNQSGVIGFVNNHGYLDNPTFRGMRWKLLQTFDKIYIINLHGSSRKKEQTPDGGKDENLFAIQTGVAINIFVKTGKKKHGELAEVFYRDVWGLADDKSQWLFKHTRTNSGFKKLFPQSPCYFFIPKKSDKDKNYNRGFSVAEMFPLNTSGIVTARDHLAVQFSFDEMRNTLEDFISLSVEDARYKYSLGRDVRDWSVERAQKDVRNTEIDEKNIVPFAYRPFDTRYTCYTGNGCGFQCNPRDKIMRHIIGRKNTVLITTKNFPQNQQFDKVLCVENISDAHIIGSNGYVFPLYTYSSTGSKSVNLNPDILSAFTKITGEEQTPEQIFDYIYAVLYRPKYRQEFAEFLKFDFPKIPYPETKKEFAHYVKFGAKLRQLHLFKKVPASKVRFDIAGGNRVDEVRYSNGNVWMNKVQYFGHVSESVWDFCIDQKPAQEYLKDRRGRELTAEEIEHYCNIIAVLEETERIMQDMP
ncbi:MAG: N-6 DNA methylase [Planctomycetaceae bacterium]|jgi:type I restriction-modification system DNA methylase subunit|nr:N-6 DNA methylase [Planctomycetaceae bacterium]